MFDAQIKVAKFDLSHSLINFAFCRYQYLNQILSSRNLSALNFYQSPGLEILIQKKYKYRYKNIHKYRQIKDYQVKILK